MNKFCYFLSCTNL